MWGEGVVGSQESGVGSRESDVSDNSPCYVSLVFYTKGRNFSAFLWPISKLRRGFYSRPSLPILRDYLQEISREDGKNGK